mmetsp:Transcript_58035/g.62715  ORF Transcript_58035/g.62715 Transcript_58035/m.62715 type:complete len:485 (-) Transcript_58035:205-1659(-)
MMSYSLYLVFLIFVIKHNGMIIVDCFSLGWNSKPATTTTTTTITKMFSTTARRRSPSKISDPSGPTVSNEPEEFEPVKLEDIPEAHYDEKAIPIPHQPWRRGETAGCEDPIDSIWRTEAERMIKMGVEIVGGTYVDTTWYLTSVVVTIGMDFQDMKRDLLRENGPEIRVDYSTSSPIYYDPDDPNPEDIDFEEDQKNSIYERDYEAERALANKSYVKADIEDGDEDESPESLGLEQEDDVPLYVDKEFREDLALRADTLRELRNTKMDDPVDWDDMFWLDKIGPEHKKYYGEKINTAALSTIAASVLEALKEREDELQVLARHEVTLASPSNPTSLDTQKKFDAAIGNRVAVRTHDPWNSNRSLYGILVDRNTLDVYINQKGRLVTIPNNFVAGVELLEGDELEELEDNDEEDEELELSDEEEHAILMKKRLADFEEELKAAEEEEYDEGRIDEFLNSDDEYEEDENEEEEDSDDEEEDGIDEE